MNCSPAQCILTHFVTYMYNIGSDIVQEWKSQHCFQCSRLFSWWSVFCFFLSAFFFFFHLLQQEDVDEFMKQDCNESAEAVIKRLDEQHQKYKFMELNLMQKKRRYIYGCQCLCRVEQWKYMTNYWLKTWHFESCSIGTP